MARIAVSIDDDLAKRARAKAARRGIGLSEIVDRALREFTAADEEPVRLLPPPVRTKVRYDDKAVVKAIRDGRK